MLRKNIILILLLLPVAAYCQFPDCNRFREGRFRTADSRVGAIVVTERRSDYQTESTEALKLVVRFSISWQDNCSFTLKLDKVVRNENKIDIPRNLTVNVKIVNTAAGTYTEEITSSIDNVTYRAIVNKTD